MIFTTNVVDWQQSVLDSNHSVSNHVWQHTVAMLEILRTNDISGTFFIQSKVASKYPVLVRKIKNAGHEVGCFIDTPYDKQSFQKVAENAIHNLQDISGSKVIGTRCNGISIKNTSFDNYCNVLRNQGIQYDSSLITNQTIDKHMENNPSLGAFKAYGISQYSIPSFFVSPILARLKLTFGGSTLRLLPYEFTHLLANNKLDRESAVFHLPIYDLGIKDYSAFKTSHDIPWQRKLDFLGRKTIPAKLHKLFGDYPFDNFKNYYFDGYG